MSQLDSQVSTHVDAADRWRAAFNEYMVDTLGSLVPGTIFLLGIALLAGSAFSLAWAIMLTLALRPLDNLASIQTKAPQLNLDLLASVAASWGSSAAFWLVVLTLCFFVCYLVGHLFYRRTPKVPDERSLSRIVDHDAQYRDLVAAESHRPYSVTFAEWRQRISDKIIGRVRPPESLKSKSAANKFLAENYACSSIDSCEFPYDSIDSYLYKRGLYHLRGLVRWRSNQAFRSKNYINILKIRLQFHCPERCRAIVRNEAHIRLTSSAWYACGALQWLALPFLGLALLISAILIFGFAADFYSLWFLAAAIAWPAAIPLCCRALRRWIEEVFHYQRLRETIFVLETAFLAFRNDASGLEPPFPADWAKPVTEPPTWPVGASSPEDAIESRASPNRG